MDILHHIAAPLQSRTKNIAISNQRGLNSCVAIAMVDALSFTQPDSAPAFSTMFVYYTARKHLGRHNHNTAIAPDDAIHAIKTWGVCCADQMQSTSFRDAPTQQSFDAASGFKSWNFTKIPPSVDALIAALKTRPVFMCLRLYRSNFNAFKTGEIARTGILTVPTSRDEALFNHAMLCVGYDAQNMHFIFRNSLGAEWGHEGYAFVPSAYFDAKDRAYAYWCVSPEP